MDVTENVYLVQKAYYVGKKPYYKIGRTFGFGQRRKPYGSSCAIIAVKTVRVSDEVEARLKAAFNKHFALVIGEETFEGDIRLMYKLFEEVTAPYAYVNPFIYPVEMETRVDDETEDEIPITEVVNTTHLSIENLRLLSLDQLMSLALESLQSDRSIQCPKCCKFKRNSFALRQHLENQVKCCYQTVLIRNAMTNSCPRCRKVFADKWNVKTHLLKNRCKVLIST